MRYFAFGSLVALTVMAVIIVLSNRVMPADYNLFALFEQKNLAFPFAICIGLGVLIGVCLVGLIVSLLRQAKVAEISDAEIEEEPIVIAGE